MNTIERILQLVENQSKNENALTKECNINSSSFSDWRRGKAKPSAEALVKIADYFNVTTDYLLCRTDNPYPNNYIIKNNIPQKVLLYWELLHPHEVTVVTNLIENLLGDRTKQIHYNNNSAS